jgi:DNA-binding PadR family transcriptional regulator
LSPVFRHGSLRLYLLRLLDEEPRHGYEVIRLLRDRFMGVYSPSPGTIYPRLARLEEEGLVTHDEVEGRKVYRITEAGREELRSRSDELDELEEELSASVSDIVREVREDVRQTVRSLREELTRAARESRQMSRDMGADAHEQARQARDEAWEQAKQARDEAKEQAKQAHEDAKEQAKQAHEDAKQAYQGAKEQARQAHEEAKARVHENPWEQATEEDEADQPTAAGRSRAETLGQDTARRVREHARRLREEAQRVREGAGAGARFQAEDQDWDTPPGWAGRASWTEWPGRRGWEDWTRTRGRRGWPGALDFGTLKDLERVAVQFTTDLRKLAMQSSAVGENVITDLRAILEEALERIKTEIFGPEQAAADPASPEAPAQPEDEGPDDEGPDDDGPDDEVRDSPA